MGNTKSARREHRIVALRTVPEAIRETEFKGESHVIVPLIALVEGVLHAANASNPELALASEFADVPQAWNGRPVTLGHPIRNNEFVSANSPEVLASEQNGFIFNAQLKDKRLFMEAWLNVERVGEDELARLMSGDEIEVSTGFFADIEPTNGTFRDQEFRGIQRNIKPDHLAILPEGALGACSFEDGCGAPRLNQGVNMGAKAGKTLKGVNLNATKCECGTDVCSCNVKKPEHVLERAQSAALGLFEQDSTEIKALERFLAQRITANNFLLFNEDGTVSNLGEDPDLSDLQFQFNREFIIIGPGLEVLASKDNDEDAFTLAAMLADKDLITTTVAKKWGTRADNGVVFLEIVGFTGESITNNEGDDTMSNKSKSEGEIKRTFTKLLELMGLSANKEDPVMDKEAKVDALIANEGSTFGEDDRKGLLALSDKALDAQFALINANEGEGSEPADPAEPEDADAPNADAEPAPAAADAPDGEEDVSVQSFLESAPQEVREVFAEGHAALNEKRNVLIKGIKTNKRNPFSDKQLEAFGIDELKNLAALGAVPDYSGVGGPRANTEEESHTVSLPSDIYANIRNTNASK